MFEATVIAIGLVGAAALAFAMSALRGTDRRGDLDDSQAGETDSGGDDD